MVVFTTYDRQVYHGFVYLVDFPKLLPGRILSAVRLKICPPQKIVESRQTIRTCKVLVMTENLSILTILSLVRIGP